MYAANLMLMLDESVDQLKGRKALQRNLGGSMHQGQLHEVDKAKCQFPPLGHNNSLQGYRLEAELLESCPAEKDMGVLVDSKLNTRMISVSA
ncbi:hypothetical protein DUI87_07475 [Hirundo rustica rustica]|uniref:Uncharacterized protein n=1 Tax=Hirundo rustica rustica TaxID=333673 RepID=A0A3M0KQC0_HIRRU|nr:hypothetical protein DUI87_07475 [Hirundo rustica rustica]